jgi:hypothetical protein
MRSLTNVCGNINYASCSISLITAILPVVASARDPDPQRDFRSTTCHIVRSKNESPTEKWKTVQIDLDASAGSTLKKLLSDLGADVEWGNDSLAQRVINGSYHGSQESIAKELLGDLNFAIFRDHSRLRVIVMGSSQKAVTTSNVPATPQVVPQKAPQTVKPAVNQYGD